MGAQTGRQACRHTQRGGRTPLRRSSSRAGENALPALIDAHVLAQACTCILAKQACKQAYILHNTPAHVHARVSVCNPLQVHDGTYTPADQFLKDPDSLCSTVTWKDEEDRVIWVYRIQVRQAMQTVLYFNSRHTVLQVGCTSRVNTLYCK
jgi:hypothetical protein